MPLRAVVGYTKTIITLWERECQGERGSRSGLEASLCAICYNRVNSSAEDLFLEPAEIARKAVEVATDKQATDIVMLDMKKVCSFADYFVICSSGSDRQLKALCESIDETLNGAGTNLLRREGTVDSGWVLLDFGDVIVHIFAQPERDYYQLDKLWTSATTVLRLQ